MAIERRGPTDEVLVVLRGRNEEETGYGYSQVCKRLAGSCWDDRHSIHRFEAYNYRRLASLQMVEKEICNEENAVEKL